MKSKLLLITIFLISFSAISQTDFESGYLIQNNGNKVECLIKNEDWIGSPKNFEYKLEENGEVKLGDISNIKEFGAGESFKYILTTLAVDQSTDVVNNLTDVRNPVMKEETLFLKTLVEGEASLYFTERENVKRYFYKLDDGEIEQLIYKRYLASSTTIGKNERYKQQLITNLKCSTLENKNFENIEYKKSSLINLFTKYNVCKGSENLLYKEKENNSGFNLSLRAGVTFGSLSILKSGNEEINFDSNTGIRIGLEAEYILPFNNGKWSIFIEPAYRNYKAEKEYQYVDFITIQKTTLITAEYNSIELPLGGRHYMFVNQNSAIFIDAAIVIDASILDSKIESSNENSYDLDVKTDAALAFGVGFKYKNKYSLEARYHTARKISNYTNVITSYNSFALIAGYNFF